MTKHFNKVFTSILFFFLFVSGNSQVSKRIVGGEETTIENRPYQVALRDGTDFFCGGTIIDEQYVITAAHCLVYEEFDSFIVSAGITENDEVNQDREVEFFISHPDYNDFTLDNDIAIIKLKTPLILGSKVKKINFATQADSDAGLIDPGIISTISGWGTVEEDGDVSLILKTADVPIVSLEEANGMDSYDGELTENMLAAGFKEGGVDACQGDSGGPLVVANSDNTSVILAGVVSWGYGCARENLYGIYCNVFNYEDWILNILAGNPVANMVVNKYARLNEGFDISNLSVNASSYDWMITKGEEVVFSSSEVELEYEAIESGLYEVSLTASADGLDNTIVKYIHVLGLSSSCETLSDFDKTNTEVFLNDNSINLASIDINDGLGLGAYFDNASEELLEVKSFKLYLQDVPEDLENQVFINMGSNVSFSFEALDLSNFSSELKNDQTVSASLADEMLVEPEGEFYVEVSSSDLWLDNQQFSLKASPKSEGESYYLDDDFNEIFYDDLELGIELEVCYYPLEKTISGTEIDLTTSGIQLFPNPVNNGDEILIDVKVEGFVQFKTIDGSVVKSVELSEGLNSVNSLELKSGLYIWEFKGVNNIGANGKFIVK